MNTIIAIIIGLTFLYVIFRYYIKLKVYYETKIENTIKSKGYRSYRQYNHIEGKAERKRVMKSILEKESL